MELRKSESMGNFFFNLSFQWAGKLLNRKVLKPTYGKESINSRFENLFHGCGGCRRGKRGGGC